MNAAIVIPIIIAIIAIVPGTLAYVSGRRQEKGKATREDFDSLRAAYREDNQELRERIDRSESDREVEREEWRERLRRVEASEEVCTRRLSWLLGKLNIPLSDLDKGMNGEPIKF
jgi:hypothetical protein